MKTTFIQLSFLSTLLLTTCSIALSQSASAQKSGNKSITDADIRPVLTSAHDAAMKCTDLNDKVEILCQIACYQEQVGDDQSAKRTLADTMDAVKLNTKKSQSWDPIWIALTQGRLGLFDAEKSTFTEAAKHKIIGQVFAAMVAPELVRFKQSGFAEELLTHEKSPYMLSLCYASLAAALGQTGDPQGGEALIKRAKTFAAQEKEPGATDEILSFIGLVEANTISISQAEQTALHMSIGKDRDDLLTAIAAREARLNKVQPAIETCKKIGTDGARQAAYALISGIRSEADDPEDSAKIADSIKGQADRAIAYSALARCLQRLGKADDAKAAIATAVEASRLISEPLKRAKALMNIGVTQSQMGLADAADTLKRAAASLVGVKGDFESSMVVTQIGKAYAKIGRADDGVSKVTELYGGRIDLDTVCEIAIGAATHGDYTKAHDLARTTGLVGEERARRFAIKIINRREAFAGLDNDALTWTLSLTNPANQADGLVGIAEGMIDKLHSGTRRQLELAERFDDHDEYWDSDPSWLLEEMGIDYRQIH